MKIDKIEILTSNEKHKTDIALLVSNIDFLKALQKLREKWDVKTLFGTSEFDNFYLLKVQTKTANVKEAQRRIAKFNNDIDKLLKKFHRDRNFKKVVEYALATGTVPEGIYQSCYFDIAMINELEDSSKPERYRYIIVMSPRTEKQEVDQAYYEFEKHIRGYEPNNDFDTGMLGKINFENSTNTYDAEIPTHRELIEQYHKGNVYSAVDISKFKTQKELDRSRELHWIRYEQFLNGTVKEPLKPAEVYKVWQNKCPLNKDRKLKVECYCDICIVTFEKAINSLKQFEYLLENS